MVQRPGLIGKAIVAARRFNYYKLTYNTRGNCASKKNENKYLNAGVGVDSVSIREDQAIRLEVSPSNRDQSLRIERQNKR